MYTVEKLSVFDPPLPMLYNKARDHPPISPSGILLFTAGQSMTPITWQAAVDDEEQRPLLQDIFEAAIDRNHV